MQHATCNMQHLLRRCGAAKETVVCVERYQHACRMHGLDRVVGISPNSLDIACEAALYDDGPSMDRFYFRKNLGACRRLMPRGTTDRRIRIDKDFDETLRPWYLLAGGQSSVFAVRHRPGIFCEKKRSTLGLGGEFAHQCCILPWLLIMLLHVCYMHVACMLHVPCMLHACRMYACTLYLYACDNIQVACRVTPDTE